MRCAMDHRNKIGFEIGGLSNLIRRKFETFNSINDANRLTGRHGFVIGFLYENLGKKDIFQRDIEIEFSIRRSTVTGILQLMEKNGLIIRESVDYDARLKKLILTPKAFAIHETFMREVMEFETQLTKGVTEEEISCFLSTLEKFKKNIE
jgi:DNA-binding MarR family transcriptional regulator